jgi:hypothetical protein
MKDARQFPVTSYQFKGQGADFAPEPFFLNG